VYSKIFAFKVLCCCRKSATCFDSAKFFYTGSGTARHGASRRGAVRHGTVTASHWTLPYELRFTAASRRTVPCVPSRIRCKRTFTYSAAHYLVIIENSKWPCFHKQPFVVFIISSYVSHADAPLQVCSVLRSYSGEFCDQRLLGN